MDLRNPECEQLVCGAFHELMFEVAAQSVRLSLYWHGWEGAGLCSGVTGVFVRCQLGTELSRALRRPFQATESPACETQDQDKALQVEVFNNNNHLSRFHHVYEMWQDDTLP